MQLPGPLRAVVGLLATAADEAKHLPDRAIELPMLAVSSALQMSLRAQQRYARLAARGDDVINRRPPGEQPPAWATFDDPVSVGDLTGAARGDGADDRARAAGELLDSLFGPSDDAPPSSNGIAEARAPTARGRTGPARVPREPAHTPSPATCVSQKLKSDRDAARSSIRAGGLAPTSSPSAPAGPAVPGSSPAPSASSPATSASSAMALAARGSSIAPR